MYPSNAPQTQAGRPKKITVADIRAAKADCRPITMSTAYDALFGALMDEAGI